MRKFEKNRKDLEEFERELIEGRCTRLRTDVTIDGHRPWCSKVLYTDEDEMIESMRTSHV